MQKKSNHQESSTRDGFVRFLQRGGSKTKGSSKPVTNSPSPSAWALSPGRTSPLMVKMEPQGYSFRTNEVRAKCSKGGGGRVSGVLKYFSGQKKKVSPIQEEEYHQFRVVYNRMLQWRFANARAEVAMAAVNIDAQADVESMHEAISAAIEVMDGIKASIINIFSQPVEKMLYLITEVISMVEQEKQCLEEMEDVFTLVPPQIFLSEQSLIVHLIQAAKESWTKV
ncbi:putative C2H2 zinc finger protein [Hibiscus syriacus]|uniref:C2H2 zinc finger protein n=1 Tax=Hibiscus syriacus TaxID=106335 RepID=A0A6A2WRL4_HIBSY|nr:putative C2H2 zinc finger protein [Hibiscus syriacus]